MGVLDSILKKRNEDISSGNFEPINAAVAHTVAAYKCNEDDIKKKEMEEIVESAIQNAYIKSLVTINDEIKKAAKAGNFEVKIYCMHISWLNGMHDDECKELTRRLENKLTDLGYKFDFHKANGRYTHGEFASFTLSWVNEVVSHQELNPVMKYQTKVEDI